MNIKTNRVYNCDCLDLMSHMKDNFVDLTITSPPYDDVRDYNGYSFKFEEIAKELYRITKIGGVIVWIVGDQIKDRGESLTSMRQALYFVDTCGFKMHQTMFYQKRGLPFPDKSRYNRSTDYVFVLKKGAKLKTFNPISDKENKYAGNFRRGTSTERQKDGGLLLRNKKITIKKFGKRSNVWEYSTGFVGSSPDKIAFEHPALFPEKLCEDHIISWSNEQDIIFDPFMGSGTTFKMSIKNKRYCIGSEISSKYCELMSRRFKDLKYLNLFEIITS